MSKKRYIDTHFWDDTWIADQLTRDERYFFLYLLTNGKTNVAGVYEISIRTIASESEFSRQEIQQMLMKMKSRVVYIDGWIVLRNGIKNQNYKNEKINRGICLVLEQCPKDALGFIDFPDDFDKPKQINTGQTTLLDESSMSHGSIYNLNSDSDLNLNSDSKNNSSAVLEKPDIAVSDFDIVGRKYWQVIKTYKLPVMNNNNLKNGIKKLLAECGVEDSLKYLDFLLTDYPDLLLDKKPELSEGLEIYSKRKRIENAVKRTSYEHSRPGRGWRAKTA